MGERHVIAGHADAKRAALDDGVEAREGCGLLSLRSESEQESPHNAGQQSRNHPATLALQMWI